MRLHHLVVPLIAVLAASCSTTSSVEQLPSKPGLFEGDDAERLAFELAESWLLDRNRDVLFGVDDFVFTSAVIDELGMAHVRVQQTEGGVPVFGGDAVVHLGPDGSGTFSDGFVRSVRVDTDPTLTSDDAIGSALMARDGGADTVEAELFVFRQATGDRLTWRVRIVDVEDEEPSIPVVFVDAHTGEEVWSYDDLQTAKNRNTYSANNGSSLPGTLKRSEGSSDIGDLPVDAAHNNAGITYDYYLNEQGRDSYNNLGATLTSTAHYSVNYDNAYWSGSQMVYGDGGTYFFPLSQALDVVAHELTHAVTDFSADLIYSGESGGLNEATSDILGATIESYSRGWVVDSDTWLIGEDIAKPALGSALRYMDNPPADGLSIDNYSDYTAGMDVHFSSGIANKAFYLMVQDPALTIEQAADIWYRALTLYMTASTNFAAARVATLDAAEDLFGAGSAQVTAVDGAWAQVGVTAPLTYTVFDTRSSLSASTGNQTQYQFVTPTGATAVQFQISGGTGDADLYVRFGSAPTTTTYDCRPYLNGNSETCTFNPASAGTYHVMLVAYSTYSGVTLTAASAGGSPVLTEDCDDGVDNDADGAIDCADSACAGEPVCAPDEVCDDGVDNDLDGDADCDDSDCDADAACASACPGGEYSGTLSTTNKDDIYTYTTSFSGLFEAELSGDAGTDFDLYLEYLSGTKWKTRASSLGPTSDEYVSYNDGSVVQHRWKVKRWSGTGDYTLCILNPQ